MSNSLAALATVSLCLPALAGGCVKSARPATGSTVTVMTYNVNFGMPRADQALAAIREGNADIVCLQETTPGWEQLIRAHLGREYPHVAFRHYGAAGGQAILSRWPFEELAYHKPKDGWFPGWAVQASTAAGDVQILSVHLRPSLRPDGRVSLGAYFKAQTTRRNEISELLGRLDATAPTLVVGDFNEGDHGRAVSLLRKQGFSDALAEFDLWSETWRWPTTMVTLRGRLDHVLYSRRLECLQARAIHKGASDHFPVVARFQAAENLAAR